ncbi:hypothetical protein MKW92_011209 [Papaver armeniacum]|nr:hypothetical protein MKW92_011209 [Papaver armeniacum]
MSNGNQQLYVIDKKESEQEEEEEVQEVENSKDEVDDIRNRLEDIKLASQEHELSEEQLKVNDRLQEEEILALEAIYGENVIVLDREDSLRSFQINIHIEVSDKFVMSTRMDVELGGIGSEAMTIADDNSNGFLYSFKVQYLPPIVLTCLLPKAYPSHSAPFFSISVQWLDTMRISSLCKMLDMIWTGQSGQEIVYSWVDWLHTSSLSYLEFENGILLGSFEKADNAGDRRAISTSVSPDVDIPSILNYNDDKCNEKFCQNLHECSICLSEHAGTKFVRLPCKHFFCRNCMETYSTMRAKEIATIMCPQIKCRELVPPGLVKSLLGDENFEQWESSLFHKTLDTMSDLVYCPRCEMACFEDEEHFAQCPKCLFTFCSLCRDRLHVGAKCKTSEEKLEVLQVTYMPYLVQKMEIKRNTKECPKCSAPIFRTAGCNRMRCSKCEQVFCYGCGKKIEIGNYLCICGLYGREVFVRMERQEEKLHQERRREDMMKQRQVVQLYQEYQERQRQILVKNPANHAHSCPMCRHMNAKVDNNNHIFCSSCQKHYCYLCRKIVIRSSQHYVPKGCKQHSAG